MGIRMQTGDWATLHTPAAQVRTAVFVQEQGIPAELELDEQDALSLHCVAWIDDQPVATGRLLPDGHIGRMAVLAQHRRAGLGGLILQALLDAATARGDREAVLSAQSYVAAFYARHGFVPEGEPYDEVGIEHQRMRLALPGAARARAAADHGDAATAAGPPAPG